jgi:hypothetical protein
MVMRIKMVWDTLLPFVSFAFNNEMTVRGKCPGADKYFIRVQEAIQVARRTLESSQRRQKAYADENRREVKFNLEDKVLLSTKNIVLKKGSSR